MQNEGYTYSDATKQYLAETVTNADTLMAYPAVSHPLHKGSMCWHTHSKVMFFVTLSSWPQRYQK